MLLVDDQLPEGSVYRLLAVHGAALFGDEYFADLFKRSALGRPTVPARVVAAVMLLQAHEGLSDREACDRLAFDLRWKAAAGMTVSAGAFALVAIAAAAMVSGATARSGATPLPASSCSAIQNASGKYLIASDLPLQGSGRTQTIQMTHAIAFELKRIDALIDSKRVVAELGINRYI